MTVLNEQLLQEVLTESTIGAKQIPKLAKLVTTYLKRTTRKRIGVMPTGEQFKNANGKGWGLRIIWKEGGLYKSVRLNWKTAGKLNTSATLISFDYWDGKAKVDNPAPTYTVKLDKQLSLVKVLPMVANVIVTPSLLDGKVLILPASSHGLVESGTIIDGDIDGDIGLVESTNNPLNTLIDSIANMIDEKNKANVKPKKGDFYTIGKKAGNSLYEILQKADPKLFTKSGASLLFNGTADQFRDVANTAINKSAFVTGTVKRGVGGKERIATESSITKAVSEADRVSFEQQLKDLKNLVKLVVVGATNALFVAGRGGVGKTHGVEETLTKDHNLVEEETYFKITGVISEIGLYTTLYKHRDSIILFDDCDAVFNSQNHRNLIKAATDTKNKRRLSWRKKSSFIVDKPETDPFWEEENDDNEFVPAMFTFTGRIIFISNLNRDKLDPDGALRTRGVIIDINPTEEEVWDFIERIMDNIELPVGELSHDHRLEVVQYLRKTQNVNNPANIRKAVRGFAMRAADIGDWKSLMIYA